MSTIWNYESRPDLKRRYLTDRSKWKPDHLINGTRAFRISIWYSRWTEFQLGCNVGLDGPNINLFFPFGIILMLGWFGARLAKENPGAFVVASGKVIR
jgi:hypothetical protein